MVCGLLMETLPSSSMIEAPCDQSSQLAVPLPSPTALPSAKPAGLPAAFSFLHISRKPGRSAGGAVRPIDSIADLRHTSGPAVPPKGRPIQLLVPCRLPYFSPTYIQPPYFLPRYSAISDSSISLSA